jgi:hypothetical protein
MAAFPTTIQFEWRDFAEQNASVVLRTEMERGVPKQRRINSDAMVTLTLTMNFKTKAAFAAFDAWFYGDALAGAAWFDFVHPRTGATVQARFVGGAMGNVRFGMVNLENVLVTSQLEFLRSAY